MVFSKLLPAIILLISTCNLLAAQTTASAQTESSSAESKLANTQWRLMSFGATGAESPVIEGTTITLKFGADGRAGGSGGCNSYGGGYRERGDNLSFNQIISTKRACLEQGANQQEQRYFTALESASKFKLSDNRLTLFHGDGQSALNFVNDQSSKSAEQRYENLNSPVELLASFYNAVNAKEYERAYRYWETLPGSFQDFARGYAETGSVRLIIEPPTRISSAAGSVYSEVPTVLAVRHRDGSERIFVGCYVTRKSNLRPSDVPKEEVWRIYRASMSPVAPDSAIPKLLAQACRNQSGIAGGKFVSDGRRIQAGKNRE
ncbi:MAG: META domain-containing protein [Pyrinomonadaceae bacterium]|nr:META domain-containing protein [Pyrinomonadaceae bacterium]